ncbi:MAG: hypothetical protein IPJ79_07720 [Bacteroidetes bacterium]|nr:hypothetical protein [Bacteroidota bacterium]
MVLYEAANNEHQFYGFGINGGALRYQVEHTGANHIFYASASATTSNELMRIQGNGNVGIGTTSPDTKLDVSRADAAGDGDAISFGSQSYKMGKLGEITSDNGVYLANVYGANAYIDFRVAGNAVANTKMRVHGNGNVGIGTTAPSNKLDVTGNTNRVVNGINTITSADYYGVFGSTNNTPFYGYGVGALGGYIGVNAAATLAGTGSRYGVLGNATGGTTNNYGVYGTASGTGAYGVYAAGNFTCTGTKAATVKTPDGPKELYSQESPENWFEDFGKGTIQNGVATVTVAPDYEQTVTINATHPMHAFITPNGNMGNWWIEYNGNTFTVHAPTAANGTAFDYRMVAKRKGYEDLRLKKAPGAYTDKFLYPNVNDVPSEYREAWLKQNAPMEQSPAAK